MKDNTAHMHYVGKEISPEQFIFEYTFDYAIKGVLNAYDGSEYVSLKSGECCLARKNRLACYNKLKENNELEKVFVFLMKPFSKGFRRNTKAKRKYLGLPIHSYQ